MPAGRDNEERTIMIRKCEILLTTILTAALFCPPGWGQGPPATILQIDIENWVEYVDDTPDTSKWAINPNATPASVPKNFTVQLGIADIVAVNGQPVKG